MLYVSYPCADIVRNSIATIYGTHQNIKSKQKRIPNTKFRTVSFLVVRYDSTAEGGIIHELNDVEQHVHNKFKLTSVTEDTLKHLKQINHFIVYS